MHSQVSDAAQLIADALAPSPPLPSMRWRWGTVTAVNSDGTMDVDAAGSAMDDVPALASAMGAAVGDRVRVDYLGTSAVVVGVLATGAAVETLYDQSGWTVMRCGNIVIVQAHGASCSGSTTTACSYVIPAAYRPAYNASSLIASTGTGVFSRLYVNASTGAISTASVGTTSTNTWYGTLVYAYAS